jgi:hypothetical protein
MNIEVETVRANTSSVLNRVQLKKIKLRALRAGVWFKTLPKIDRVLVDLTIKVTENIRSPHLAKSLFVIVEKLEGLMETRFQKLAKTVGRSLAEKTSQIAQSWGNVRAKRWSTDRSFALYLAVLQANK